MRTTPILLAALALAAAIPANAEPGAGTSPPTLSAATMLTDGGVDFVALYRSCVAEDERKMTAVEGCLYREYLHDGGELSREAWTVSMTGRSEPAADHRYRDAPYRDNRCQPGRWTACGSTAWAWQFKSTSAEGTKP